MNISTMFSTIDTHVAGEAFRIVTHSPLNLNKQDIKANHEILHQVYQEECDFLLSEPRGHRGMKGCIVLSSKRADFGVLLFANNKASTFSYSGLVAVITALLETGNLERTKNDNYMVETVYGIYNLQATYQNEQVTSVRLENNDSHVIKNDADYQIVDVDGSRRYVVTDLPDKIQNIKINNIFSIIKWGEYAVEAYAKKYPELSGVILTSPKDSDYKKVRSITFEPSGNIVRSPGIDSTLAILALSFDAGKTNTQLVNKSVFDSTLTAQVINGKTKRFSVETQGFITGMHHFIYDKDDPLQKGFLLN